MKKRILTLGLFVAMMLGANSVSASDTIECNDFIIVCKYGEMHMGIICGGTREQQMDDLDELGDMLC